MSMRSPLVRILLAVACLPLVAATALAQPPAPPQGQTVDDKLVAAMHGISSHPILDWVKELASEKYQGRLTGTPSYDASAAWAA